MAQSRTNRRAYASPMKEPGCFSVVRVEGPVRDPRRAGRRPGELRRKHFLRPISVSTKSRPGGGRRDVALRQRTGRKARICFGGLGPGADSVGAFAPGSKVSVDAKVDAGFQAGFLGVNFAGSIGTDITIETGYSSSGTAPWRDYWPTGTAYKIVDSAGKQMVYVQSYKSALYSSESTTEQLTRDQGESRAVANGAYPFVHVAAYHNNTYTYTLTVTVTVDVEFSVSAIGVSLTVHLASSSGRARASKRSTSTSALRWRSASLYTSTVWRFTVGTGNDGACPY